MSDEASNPKDDLDSVVNELRSGLEDGSIVLDRRDATAPTRTLASMRAEAEKLIERTVTSNVGAFWSVTAIPGATAATVTDAKISLIYNLARIYGFNPSMEESKEILSALGGLTAATIASEALSFIPVVGWAIKPGIVFGVMRTFGKAAINYFQNKYQQAHP